MNSVGRRLVASAGTGRGRVGGAFYLRQKICEPVEALDGPTGKEMQRERLRDASRKHQAQPTQALASRRRARNVSRSTSLVGPQGPRGLNAPSARR